MNSGTIFLLGAAADLYVLTNKGTMSFTGRTLPQGAIVTTIYERGPYLRILTTDGKDRYIAKGYGFRDVVLLHVDV